MDSSNTSKNRGNEYLGVNKMGKNIKKSPLHQPSFGSGNPNNSNGNNSSNPVARPQSQPQVYNISKNDFRSVVQRLTGSPLHSQEPLPPRPPNSAPKHPSNRLHRIRPPPLTPINRPMISNVVPVPGPGGVQPPLLQGPMPPPHMAPILPPMQGPGPGPGQGQGPYNNHLARPPHFGPPSPAGRPPHFGPLSPAGRPPLTPNWLYPQLSPISAYMQQLQSCMNDPSIMPSPSQPPFQPAPGQGPQFQPQGPSSVHPNPPILPFPSPRMNSPALLPSPNSQFLLPSPSMPSPSFFNMLSPTSRSPYPFPFPSPGSQFPPPLSPNFSFPPPMAQPGILGPGPPGPPPPFSPGAFPLSPSMFFPGSSPRWRNQ